MKKLLVICSLLLASTAMTHAEDNCESTEQKVPHTIGCKNHVCDKCVILGCDASGRKTGQCTRTTKYTNCVEAEKSDAKTPEKKK